MRYLIKFTKEDHIKFISHLDLMRTIQRTIRRAEIPIGFSQGFNPHMALSLAQPLSVGMHSSGDYLDIELVEDLEEEVILNKLNNSAPMGVRFLDVARIEPQEGKKAIQSMALLDAARYKIIFKCLDAEKAEKELGELLKEKVIEILKEGKKGTKNVDIRPFIKECKFWVKDGELIINTLVSCGSRENLSAGNLTECIEERCQGIDKGKFINVKREEMYAYKNNDLVPLEQYYR